MCSILHHADNIGEDIILHPENDKLCKLHFQAKIYCFVSVDEFIEMISLHKNWWFFSFVRENQNEISINFKDIKIA